MVLQSIPRLRAIVERLSYVVVNDDHAGYQRHEQTDAVSGGLLFETATARAMGRYAMGR